MNDNASVPVRVKRDTGHWRRPSCFQYHEYKYRHLRPAGNLSLSAYKKCFCDTVAVEKHCINSFVASNGDIFSWIFWKLD